MFREDVYGALYFSKELKETRYQATYFSDVYQTNKDRLTRQYGTHLDMTIVVQPVTKFEELRHRRFVISLTRARDWFIS
jgi:hypothetical protein